MSKTMTDYLQRRLRLSTLLLGVGVVMTVLAVVSWLAVDKPRVGGPGYESMVFAVRYAGIVLAWVVGIALVSVGGQMRLLPGCPRCGQKLSAKALPVLCSGCGLRIDDPLP